MTIFREMSRNPIKNYSNPFFMTFINELQSRLETGAQQYSTLRDQCEVMYSHGVELQKGRDALAAHLQVFKQEAEDKLRNCSVCFNQLQLEFARYKPDKDAAMDKWLSNLEEYRQKNVKLQSDLDTSEGYVKEMNLQSSGNIAAACRHYFSRAVSNIPGSCEGTDDKDESRL